MLLEWVNIEYFSWYGFQYSYLWSCECIYRYFSGAVSCGGALTCGTNSISMTDGTGAFSVTPTMMRALYSYYTSLGPVSLTSGSLTNMPLGSNVQHTTGSGVYYPLLSVNLATGSYNLDMMLILTYNFSGN